MTINKKAQIDPDELAYLQRIVESAWRVCAAGLSIEAVMARREDLRDEFIAAPDSIYDLMDHLEP
jgi:hypothetical protein